MSRMYFTKINIYHFSGLLPPQIRCTSPQIWEENGGASYSTNAAYQAHWERGGGAGFFSYFPSLKPRYVLWSGVSYTPKNTVHVN